MKICVLGANGFIGSNVAEHLSGSHDVTRLGRGDTTEETFEVLVNCAGLSWRGCPQGILVAKEAEVIGAVANIKAYCLVHISTSETIVDPFGVYGRTKRWVEQEVLGVKPWGHWAVLRPTMVIGPRQRKGIVRDLYKGTTVLATAESAFNIVGTWTIGKVIQDVFVGSISDGKHVIAAREPIAAARLRELLWPKESECVDVFGVWRQDAIRGGWPIRCETSEECVRKWLERCASKC